MHAIVFADRHDYGLRHLLPDSCPALLPIAGKATIEYTLEELYKAGIRHVTVFIGPQAETLHHLLGDGERWNLNLHIALSRGSENPCDLIHRLHHDSQQPLLALRGDELRSHAVGDFLHFADHQQACMATDEYGTAAMVLAPPGCAAFTALIRSVAPAQRLSSLHLPGLQILNLDTPADILEANHMVIDGALRGPRRCGLEARPGLRLETDAELEDQSAVGARAYVGERSCIHPSARLVGDVVIGADCYIDRNCTLENCVILPNTYVGAGLHVRHSIVSSNGLQRASGGNPVRIRDPLWISEVRADEGVALSERMLAQLLLLVCWPLWPLAVLFERRSQHAAQHVAVVQEQAPRLAWLPGLLEVARGQLRLFGARQAADGERLPPPDPALQGISARPGLFAITAWCLPADAPAEERWLTEMAASDMRLGSQLKLILRNALTRPRRKLETRPGSL